LNPVPLALAASTLPPGYQGGGIIMINSKWLINRV